MASGTQWIQTNTIWPQTRPWKKINLGDGHSRILGARVGATGGAIGTGGVVGGNVMTKTGDGVGGTSTTVLPSSSSSLVLVVSLLVSPPPSLLVAVQL